jgi:hypothetical protein
VLGIRLDGGGHGMTLFKEVWVHGCVMAILIWRLAMRPGTIVRSTVVQYVNTYCMHVRTVPGCIRRSLFVFVSGTLT